MCIKVERTIPGQYQISFTTKKKANNQHAMGFFVILARALIHARGILGTYRKPFSLE